MEKAAWLQRISALRRDGQWFELVDVATQALKAFADDLDFVYARAFALANTGALEEARQAISPVLADVSSGTLPDHPQSARLREDLLGLVGRIYKDLWQQTGELDYLRQAKDAYSSGFDATSGAFTGINAATTAWLIGATEEARDLAQRVLQQIEEGGHSFNDYWSAATKGEAHLLLGHVEQAERAYDLAKRVSRSNEEIVSSLRQLKLLSDHGLTVSHTTLERMSLPPVLIFMGHMIDMPDAVQARFPADAVDSVAAAIAATIDRDNTSAAFGSAACGSDLIFIEALQEKGIEVNVVLPFSKNDFVESSVGFAGAEWIERFDKAMESVDSVTFLTNEKYLDDDHMFTYCNNLIAGKAFIRSQQLLTDVYAVGVVDKTSKQVTGGTTDFLERLRKSSKVIEIDLQKLRRDKTTDEKSKCADRETTQTSANPVENSDRRRMVAMLFSDVKGFSRLTDEHFAQFKAFQAEIARSLATLPVAPDYVRTVGDAIFSVAGDASFMATYAITLKKAVKRAQQIFAAFDPPMDVRIALHAAPIFDYHDPVGDRPDWFGSHVNRTARLEPVTLPGHIYATEQFISMLATEERSLEGSGSSEPASWRWHLVGTIELAKDFGAQRVFHLKEG